MAETGNCEDNKLREESELLIKLNYWEKIERRTSNLTNFINGQIF